MKRDAGDGGGVELFILWEGVLFLWSIVSAFKKKKKRGDHQGESGVSRKTGWEADTVRTSWKIFGHSKKKLTLSGRHGKERDSQGESGGKSQRCGVLASAENGVVPAPCREDSFACHRQCRARWNLLGGVISDL